MRLAEAGTVLMVSVLCETTVHSEGPARPITGCDTEDLSADELKLNQL